MSETPRVLTDDDIQALVADAEAVPASLTGVVTPPEREGTAYEAARHHLDTAAEVTKARLVRLRADRETINAEIKLLVEEEELLSRMLRIARKGATPNT